MELRDWLHKQNMAASKLAKKLGINAHYMRQIKRHEVIAGYDLAKRIEIETGGEVTEKEIRANYIGRLKKSQLYDD